MVGNVWNRLRKGGSRILSYNIKYKDDYLAHAGKKGMKWGFNDGRRNGRRTAEEILEDLRDGAGEIADDVRKIGYKSSQKVDDTLYRERLNRNGLADRYGSTLLKYGLNKIGKGTLDNKLTKAQRKAKRTVKLVARKVDDAVHPDAEITNYIQDPRTGEYKRASRTVIKNKNKWFK